MLIVCPSCASTYTIEADLLGAEGRRVRCAACRREWFVDRADPVAAPAIAAYEAVVAEIAGVPNALPPLGNAPLGADNIAAMHRPPPPFRGGAPSQARLGGIARAGRGFLHVTTAACLILLVGGLALARDSVVRALPGTAKLYAAVGVPVNLRGLEFRGVRPELVTEGDSRTLVIEGEVANVTRKGRDVPPIAVAVRNKTGQPLYSWTVDPPRERLEAGETLAFRSRLATPPLDGHDILVRFKAANERVAGTAR
jgi:predicted Zn finger-like uncharacterized protein